MDKVEAETTLVALVASYHALLTGLRLECGKLSDELATDTIIRTGEALEALSKPTALELRVAQDIETVQERQGQQ